jgi:hypothetical protein
MEDENFKEFYKEIRRQSYFTNSLLFGVVGYILFRGIGFFIGVLLSVAVTYGIFKSSMLLGKLSLEFFEKFGDKKKELKK